MDQVVFSANKRADMGSRSASRLRNSGRVPAVVYGRKGESVSLDLDALEFSKGVKGISESTIVKIMVDGASHEAFVKDMQRDIITGKILHVDFYEVESDRLVRAKVPLHIKGNAVGTREGGILENPLHELEVECFPRFLPESIDVDVSELKANQSIHVRDIKMSSDVRILTGGDHVVALVKFAKVESESSAEAAPAAAAAAAPAAAPADKA